METDKENSKSETEKENSKSETDKENSKSSQVDDELKIIERDMWMLRSCRLYKDEYNLCKNMRARMFQKYVYGEELDCSHWERKYLNCQRYQQTKSLDALKELIDSEKETIAKRLKNIKENDVWEQRSEPPKDWNDPLPFTWLEERKDSVLELAEIEKQRAEIEKQVMAKLEPRNNFCVIL